MAGKTKAEFARQAGVTSQAVGQAARPPHGSLYQALMSNGRIDDQHPSAVEFLRRHGVDAEFTKLAPSVTQVTDSSLPDDMEELKKLKLQEEIREKRLKNEETEGAVISRELVSFALMGALEELSRRLLVDAAGTISRRLYSMSRAGEPLEEAEKVTKDTITQNLNKAKHEIKRRLGRGN